MRRAKIAQFGSTLVLDPLLHGRNEPRFSEPGLAGNHDDPAAPSLGLLPAPLQQFQYFVTPNERRLAGAKRLEPTLDRRFAEHRPRQNRRLETLEAGGRPFQ